MENSNFIALTIKIFPGFTGQMTLIWLKITFTQISNQPFTLSNAMLYNTRYDRRSIKRTSGFAAAGRA